MDHNETIRKFEKLMIKQAEHAHSTATEIESMVSLLPDQRTRQLAEEQVKEIHKQSKDFRALAQKLKSN
jgi:ribosomal protein S13